MSISVLGFQKLFRYAFAGKPEIVCQHELQDQALAPAGKAVAYAKLDTVRLSLVIDHCKKGLILLVEQG